MIKHNPSNPTAHLAELLHQGSEILAKVDQQVRERFGARAVSIMLESGERKDVDFPSYPAWSKQVFDKVASYAEKGELGGIASELTIPTERSHFRDGLFVLGAQKPELKADIEKTLQELFPRLRPVKEAQEPECSQTMAIQMKAIGVAVPSSPHGGPSGRGVA